jgi:2-iminoacetate synthase
MEFAIPGFIQNFCGPNALTTLLEYLVDHATPETRAAGEQTIAREIANLPAGPRKDALLERLQKIRQTDTRDLYF